MSVDWKTQTPDGPMTDAHRAALAEWSRLLATGALSEPADEQVTAGPTVLLHQFGATIEGPTIRCSRDRGLRRFGRPLLWLLGKVVLALAGTGAGVWGLLWLLGWAVWDEPLARVALWLVAAALVAGWVAR